MSDCYEPSEDVPARNVISRWALVSPRMSGSAFSTALRHAASIDMGEALEFDSLGYDESGAPIMDGDTGNVRCALYVSVERRAQ